MTKDDIVVLPNPVLRQPSKRVPVIDQSIHDLADGMIEAVMDWEKAHPHELGAAIAAVQVGKLDRLVIIRTDRKSGTKASFTGYLNPEIVKKDGEPDIDAEGCLSVPEIYGHVLRYPKVKVRAQTLDGDLIRLTAEGFMARVFQHEVDHLVGKLFVDQVQNDEFFRINKRGDLIPLTSDEVTNSRLLWHRAS